MSAATIASVGPASVHAGTTGAKRNPSRHIPRLGFLGVGWIGRHRMNAIAAAGAGTIGVLADSNEIVLGEAMASMPGAEQASSLDELLAARSRRRCHRDTQCAARRSRPKPRWPRGLRGVLPEAAGAHRGRKRTRVIARSAPERCGLLIDYLRAAAMQRIRDLVLDSGRDRRHLRGRSRLSQCLRTRTSRGSRDPRLSGGGCVIDLGIHMVDLALWTLGFPAVERRVEPSCTHTGAGLRRMRASSRSHAVAHFDLDTGAVVRPRLFVESRRRPATPSSRRHFTATRGGASMRNVHGSFYDFVGERYAGTKTTLLAQPPDDWGGRAALRWARQLASGTGFDPDIERVIDVAGVLDEIYVR